MKDGRTIEVRPDGAVTNCLVNAELKDGKNFYYLEITFGRYYKDIEWGNYYGKRQTLIDNLSLKVKIRTVQ